MLTEGYDAGPLVPGESLVARPGFWSNYLLAMCDDGGCAERPVPEWFGEDGADTDALSEVLFDPDHWPVFRVPAEDGPGVVVVYRNLEGDYGTDYVPLGIGLTWHELIRMADNPLSTADGVQDTASRLLLLLPLLTDQDVPESASATITAALAAIGGPRDTSPLAARHLLAHLTKRPQHDPTWASPLSGS
ncbi:hypothetical protein [Streptomyces sp. SID9124]|uniref:hypothetical protein n=1 Tax=Streptomyces sp. SID9124 TaxID=2706108 RepID=UPI0013E0A403|nr:hypothetical protein [Streptomyces sp. SID9124]NED10761.1 hypothetical protein [Streptomyces sp. SID9124]